MTAVATLIAACGGGSSSSAPTVTVSGTVANDGYLSGATVCVDKNNNSVCDAGEPSAVSNASGAYSITGVTASDASAYPLVAEIPATAVDSGNPTSPVGQAFVLTTPAGQTFISPITSMAHRLLKDNSSSSLSAVVTQLNTDLQLPDAFNPFGNYVADAASTSSTSGTSATAQKIAQVVANSLEANYAVASGLGAGQMDAFQDSLVTIARLAVESEGTSPNPATGVVGAEDFNTVRASLANKLTTGTATQAVTVNFDVVNDATSVKACNAVTLANLKRWDQTSLSATPPTAPTLLANPVQQTTTGVMNDLRFYISNVLLWDANGNAVPLVLTENANQSKNVALMNFGYSTVTAPACTDAALSAWNTSITGNVVPGTYTGISFTLGVPVYSADFSTKLDHSNYADTVNTPLPLQVAALAWSWQYGRKFTKIQFVPSTPAKTFNASTGAVGSDTTLNYHIGSTGCQGNPATVTGSETSCTNQNKLGVKLSNFNAATNTVALDLAALFAGSDLTYDGGGAAGCMSGLTDPECPAIFSAMGISLTTGQTLAGAQVQTIFRVK